MITLSSRWSGTGPSDPRQELLSAMAQWSERGWLRPLDHAFAAFLSNEAPDASHLLILAAAMASHQLGRGHACLDLAAALDNPGDLLPLSPEDVYLEDGISLPGGFLTGVDLPAWLDALTHEELVGRDETGRQPLVLAGSRLYLRRYWRYEGTVAAGIRHRLEEKPAGPEEGKTNDSLRSCLDALFPLPVLTTETRLDEADWQKIACALATRHPFSIITGGPGTGKTTTVVKLLALLQAQRLAGPVHAPLRIGLAAPTGKAAARLNASISSTVNNLPMPGIPGAEDIRKTIPVQVMTLHRLLGNRPGSRHFRHHAGNPLALDVLVIDEASMVDLEMMAAVLDALPEGASLVLLGDRNQLASVEAGTVLGELCRHALQGGYDRQTVKWLEKHFGLQIPAGFQQQGEGRRLDQSIVMLRTSHRFGEESGIGRLAAAVNSGCVSGVRDIIDGNLPGLALLAPVRENDEGLRRLVVDGAAGSSEPSRQGYRAYLDEVRKGPGGRPLDVWALDVLRAHGRFQVLCAVRRGAWGVEGLNQRVAGWLRQEDLIGQSTGWYAGRPVLVTSNDYALGLMNGDIGIALPCPGDEPDTERLRVAFPAGDGVHAVKWVLPSRLQSVETVYAMTVHKSQGSEFDHAALVLPGAASPVLTRELLYTGITRAKRWFSLVNPGGQGVLAEAVTRQVVRHSGLMDRLNASPEP